MRQYLDLVQHVLSHGTRKENRTGVDTISVFGYHYQHDLRVGFPLLTTKSMRWKSILAENLWFLSGSPHVGFLHKHGAHFWDPWLNEYGHVPSGYGTWWRSFPTSRALTAPTDQIQWVCQELQKNPMSRRLVVSAWYPLNAHGNPLPPCHYTFALNVQMLADHEQAQREREFAVVCSTVGQPAKALDAYARANELDAPTPHLCIHVTQRSADTALGVPYNLAGYAFLCHLFARFANLPVGYLSHTLIDAHVYTSKPDGSQADHDHVPGLQEQLTRSPLPLPRLTIDPSIRTLAGVEKLISTATTDELLDVFRIDDYTHHPAIRFKVAV